MFSKGLRLGELVNLEDWQRMQDSFSEVLELSLATVSLDGNLLTRISRPNRLCSEILPRNPAHQQYCANCILKENKDYSVELTGETHFQCPFGLDLFVAPITAVADKAAAYMVIGPVFLNRRKEASEYVEEAKSLRIKLEQLIDVLIDINVFSYNKICSVITMVRDTFSHIAQTGYHKKRLGEMAPEIREMDPLFSRYYEEKILNSLLNTCSLALDADSGSVMTVDKKTHMLHIKAASKLDQDVINSTNIKMGEGIAGIAAATAQPIILPEDEAERGLSTKMKRKYIKSSMIIPFGKPLDRKAGSDVYGVINLNIVRKERSFSKKDIAFVQELVNLASTALIPFQNSHPNST